MDITNSDLACLKRVEQMLLKCSQAEEIPSVQQRIEKDARILHNLRMKMIREESERTFYMN